MPHGDAGGVISVATASALKSLCPATYAALVVLATPRMRTYHGGSEGNALRTRSHGIRGVLDVGTGDKFTGGGENACSDAEFGVGA